MYILTLGGEIEEGAYSVENEYGEKTLYFFVDQDDANRYAELLEADGYPLLTSIEVNDETAIKVCEHHKYRYTIIKPEDFVIPPRDYD